MRSIRPLVFVTLALAACADAAPSAEDAAPRAAPRFAAPEETPAAPAPDPAATDEPAPAPGPTACPQEQPVKPAPVAKEAEDPAEPIPAAVPDDKPAPPPAPAPAAVADDAKPAPAPPKADDAAAESERKARAVLAKAAERQNAGDLAEPEKLESFHVVFHKAIFEKDDDSGKQTIETDADGLVVDWKRGSIKTALTIDGSTTTKGWYDPKKSGWINAGGRVSSLLGADRTKDREQLLFHKKVIDQLLEVAILGRMLNDGSKWRVVDDAATKREKAVAIERLPSADRPDAVRIVLWIANPSEGEYGDVVAAAMPPTDDSGTTLTYSFTYDDQFPVIRVKGADGAVAPSKMRFPFAVEVHEKVGDAKPRKVLDVKTGAVDVNTVTDDDFKPPPK